jgi:indole-3-acetate monooxygenase
MTDRRQPRNGITKIDIPDGYGRSRHPPPPAAAPAQDLRLAMTHAAQSAATATHMVGAMAGTTSIFTSSPLERYARDAEVVTRHKQRQFVNYEAVGRTMLGLEFATS